MASSTLVRELGARGVTVNAVAPGRVDTPFYHGPESEALKAQSSTRFRHGINGAYDTR